MVTHVASAALGIFVRHPNKSFSTQSAITGRSANSPQRRLFGMLRHSVNASNAGQAPGGRQHTSWSTSLRRPTESSEPYVIAALAQRWSGLFSYSAANAVAQLKS